MERLGGADLLEREAREHKAFERARAVTSAVDLLRLAFAYCLGQVGLRLTAAWAEAVGLATLSNVALLKRLRKMAPWLEHIVGRLLGGGVPVAAARGRLIRLVDATMIAKAGREGRERGGLWRVHTLITTVLRVAPRPTISTASPTLTVPRSIRPVKIGRAHV